MKQPYCSMTGAYLGTKTQGPPPMGKREQYVSETMQQTREGFIKFVVDTEVYLGHSKTEIENTLRAHYLATEPPKGAEEQQSFWTWGLYPVIERSKTYKQLDHDEYASHFVFNRKGGPPSISYEGALLSAKEVFEVLENNKDVMLFIKFVRVLRQEKM